MKNPIERRVLLLVVATGIASVVTQLVVVREFLAQFQGNELIIALVLFNWLLLGGLGTRLAQHVKSATPTTLMLCSFGLVVLSVGQIMVIRLLRPVVFLPGAAGGFYAIFLFSALTMAPYAFAVGFVLPYSLYVIRSHRAQFPATRLYLTDNLGDICGGALFAFVLILWTTPMQALFWANLLLIVCSLHLGAGRRLAWLGALLSVSALVTGMAIEQRLLAPTVGRLVHYEESRYARLSIHEDQEQMTLFADGQPLFSSQSQALAEATVHYPLSQLNDPQRILLISAEGGITDEIGKHHPKVVDYVELDSAMTRLLVQFGMLPPLQGLNPISTDGRSWLRTNHQVYDAIMVNVPEPTTFQLNRFFTDGFFSLVKARLTAQGIFSFSVTGAANYMTPAQSDKIASLRATARRHFSHVTLLPGERTFFLCRQRPIDLDIPKRLAELGILTRFVAPYYYGDVTAQRIQALERRLDPDAPINRDTRPYLMQVMLAQWFSKFGTSPRWFIVALALLLGLYLARLRREEFVLFTTGMVAMGSEILVIFAFQIFLGYIYVKIGLIVTAFLSGLLPGAWLGHRFVKKPAVVLAISDAVVMALILVLIVAVNYGADGLSPGFYYASGFILSMACGFQIPVALALLGDDNRAAARIFSVDLVGAAFGALVTSTILIPYLGLVGAACVLIGVKLMSLLVVGERYAFMQSTHIPHN